MQPVPEQPQPQQEQSENDGGAGLNRKRLAPAPQQVWELWHLGGCDVAAVCVARHIKQSTCLNYLCLAVEAGKAYYWHRLGVPAAVEHAVRSAVATLTTAAADADGSPPPPLSSSSSSSSSSLSSSSSDPLSASTPLPTVREVRDLIPSEIEAEWWMVRLTLLHLKRVGHGVGNAAGGYGACV